MFHFFFLISRQGKCRLAKWYDVVDQKIKKKTQREVTQLVLSRPSKLCNFIEWKDQKIIFKRYASLYFVCGVDKGDNELITLEVIHEFVEALDRYFGNVCELDLIFNFHKAYYILDEVLLCGEQQETSKKIVLRVIAAQDSLCESSESGRLTRAISSTVKTSFVTLELSDVAGKVSETFDAVLRALK